ncbi:hypothetical protein TTHERM_00470880 (macronuclear) [Tetrahymena thermophila SB210]|uniref:Uncharacterized protein n=1 Tax=Tetrahymena thermophila (strain SB210) TaxID=312017 RepID=I7LTI6_TETTS|nr:hypothetical protein TTHERM_00470880 [Tetrahymena thermophila SB210]EAR85315.2 hypothetical protein TTHERM_00470880 [Tetrahymena thermophila SB210]|eukprot:XP_001032978.2 hypothetical protein TTHERM_00470880 [Tetrahymena thermophila SB210]
MNRYQQILADKKLNNGIDNKFQLNQEGFYSPTRDYKKYKKMEEFQLPDIKKYNFFPLKTDKSKQPPLHADSEPTAFQNYKKSQQITFKKIEDKSQSNRNNELSNIQLQSIPNSSLCHNTSQNTQNPHNLQKQKIETEYGLNINKQRLSLQNILQQSSKYSIKNQIQEQNLNEGNSGYNIIQSHRFRVSSLEKIKNTQIETLQQGINELNKNKDIYDQSLVEPFNTSINQSLNSSLQKIIDLNKQPKFKNKRQACSYHYDSSQSLIKQDSKIFGLSDLYIKLRQSLEEIDKCSDPLIFSERTGLKSNSPDLNCNQNKKVINMNKQKHDKLQSINNSNQNSYIAQSSNSQQNDLKDTLQNYINIQNEKIEIQIKNQNPYLSNSKNNKPQTIQDQAQKDLNASDCNLIKTEFIDKRTNQYSQVKNINKQDTRDQLQLGSTKFLNFLPHHIKKKKIQLGIQLQKGIQSLQNNLASLDQKSEYTSQNVVYSSEIYKSPQNKQNREIIQETYFPIQTQKQLSPENQQKKHQTSQNLNLHSYNGQQYQADYFKQKAQQCSLTQSLAKQQNSQRVKENKYYHNRMQSQDKIYNDLQIHSHRDFTGDQQIGVKPIKLKIEERNQQQNQNRQTFTQFLPWEDPRTINNSEIKKQQLYYKQSQTCDNSPKDSLKKNNLQLIDNSYNSSHYDRKFIDFDIQDYFLLKEKV